MLFNRERETEQLPDEWPPIIFDDRRTGESESPPSPQPSADTTANSGSTTYGGTMNQKIEIPCNCVREPCECSVEPFPSATTPPPIVTIRYITQQLKSEPKASSPGSTSGKAASAANTAATQPQQILGLPWYVVVGGAVLALWMLNSGGK